MYNPPSLDCPLCPRLCEFREDNRRQYPSFFNAPVPSFGSIDAQFLVVGLAPGLKGANQTGRPFTGDYAGLILYHALKQYGFAKGNYKERPDDGFELVNCRITNAVRCVPPENKPETFETAQCNNFLKAEIATMKNLKLILSLGSVSHSAVLKAFGHKASFAKFEHGKTHKLTDKITLIGSYHTSRYNMNTGRLTQEMFDKMVEMAANMVSIQEKYSLVSKR
jgi:uracil-DNA glycosylase